MSFMLIVVGLLLLFSRLSASLCTTESQPNPIASQYSNQVTGTINGTIAIILISYDVARNIIPSEYPILVDSYRQWLPHLPNNVYPVRAPRS